MPRIPMLFLFLMAFLPAPGVWADAAGGQGDSTVLTLGSAILSAITHNPEIIAAKSRIEASSERIVQARSGMLPQINFTESFQRTTNPMWAFGTKLNQENINQQDFAPDLLNDPDPLNNFASRIWMAWPLFDAGQTWYGLRQAGADKTAAEWAFDRTRQEVIYKTIEAYTDLLLARDSVTVVEHAVNTAKTHLRMVENRFQNGLVVKSDVLRTRVHIAELEQDQVTARSRVATARAALNLVMGRRTDLEAMPADKLSATPFPQKPLAEWVQTALTHRPDLKQVQSRLDMAELEIKKSRAAHWPFLDVNGAYEMNSEDFGDQAENYTIGANITFNLFSGLRTSARTREAVNLVGEARANQQGLIQQARLETEKSYYDLLSADSRLISAKLSTELAEEALRIIRDRYENGLLNIDSLLDSELALYRAGNNYCSALKDHVQARAGMALATGGLNPDFQ